MRLTCMGCGTDYDGDACPICHKYDDSDYVMDDSKPPRVVALEKELAEARAEIERLKELASLNEQLRAHCRFVTYPSKKLVEKLKRLETALEAKGGANE